MSSDKPATSQELYRYHARNAAAVNAAMKQLRLLGNGAIKRRELQLAKLLTRQYVLLLAALVECRLKQLTYEPQMTEPDRAAAREPGLSQAEQWLVTIDAGFVKRFQPPKDDVSRLAFTPNARRQALRAVVNQDLKPVLELRNSLAHGQWQYVLNRPGTGLNQALMQALNTETFLSLSHKERLLGLLYRAVNDLVVSGPTFERDFDAHYHEIDRARQRLRDHDWNKHVQFLQSRYDRGQRKRKGGTGC